MRDFYVYDMPDSLEFQIAGCEGKEAFDSWSIAKAIIRRRKRSNRLVYKCKFCRKFHIATAGHRRTRPKFKIVRSRELF